MKKGRHRRFEEARALKRSSEPSFEELLDRRTPEPCPECGADPGHDHASLVPGRDEDEDEEPMAGPDVPASAPPPALLSEPSDPFRELHPPPSATSPWWPTSTTARPLWSMPCCAPPASFARPPGSWSTGSWTPTTRSASGASPSSPRPPRSRGATSGSTWSTPPATPTSAARSSGRWPWSTACCCWSTPPRGPCPRPATCCRRRSPPACPTVVVLNKVDRERRPARRGARRDLRAVPRPRRRRTTTSSSRSSRPSPARAEAVAGIGMPGPDDDLTPLLRGHPRHRPGPGRRSRRPRSRPSSPTSTPPTTSAAWPSVGSCGARCARASQVALLDEEVDEGQAPLDAQAHPAAWASRASAATDVDGAGRRRPVRGRRVPRGRDRRHPRRPGTPRGRCPGSASTSPCCA